MFQKLILTNINSKGGDYNSTKFQTAKVIQKDGNKTKDYCALCKICFNEQKQV